MDTVEDLTAEEMLRRAHKSQYIILRDPLERDEVVFRVIGYFKENPDGDLVYNIPKKIELKDKEFSFALSLFSEPKIFGINMDPLINKGYNTYYKKDGSPFYAQKIWLAKGVNTETLEEFFEEYKKISPTINIIPIS